MKFILYYVDGYNIRNSNNIHHNLKIYYYYSR